MFLQNISYNVLSTVRNTIIIIFLIIMFLTTLRESRKWVCLTYVVLGLILTIVCILIIPKEIAANIGCNISIIIGIVSAICTVIWATKFGNNLIFQIRRKKNE